MSVRPELSGRFVPSRLDAVTTGAATVQPSLVIAYRKRNARLRPSSGARQRKSEDAVRRGSAIERQG